MGGDGGASKGKGKGAPRAPPAAPDPEAKEKAARAREERRLADEAKAKALEEFEQRERDFAARLGTCSSRSIVEVPWSEATICHHMAGGKASDFDGGATAVQVGGADEVVCVRQSTDTQSDMVANVVMNCIGARVAQFRVVNKSTSLEEWTAIADACSRCHPKFAAFKEVWEKWRTQVVEERGEEIAKKLDPDKSKEVLEFVPGKTLSAFLSDARRPTEQMFSDIGCLCAGDLLLNNMDRVPLTIWQNEEGNLSNIMIGRDGTIRGIDQSVIDIKDAEGMQEYLDATRTFVTHLMRRDFKHMSMERCIAKVEQAIYRVTSFKIEQGCLLALLKGMREGLLGFGKSWASGTFQAKLAEVIETAKQVKDQGTINGATIEAYLAFVLRVAEEIAPLCPPE